MKQHLLRVERPVVEFAGLIAALRHEGERVGWLELPEEAAEPVPESLKVAAEAGTLRAVAVGGGRSVSVKPMRGAPVLRDLQREHFRGCRAVLILGDIEAPLLEPDGQGWVVRRADGSVTRWTTDQLIQTLRKPRPFAS